MEHNAWAALLRTQKDGPVMLYDKSFEAYFYNLIWQVETGQFQGPLCLKITSAAATATWPLLSTKTLSC